MAKMKTKDRVIAV